MAPTQADEHPIIVYGLADVPPILRANIEPNSPLFGCCFFAAITGSTIAAAVAQAFEAVPEPPCDPREADEGLRIAGAIGTALRDTAVAMVLFATRCHEEPQKAQWGFHTGDAASFRLALERAGLTLVEGAEVFRDQMLFAVSDAPLVKRVTDGQTLSFTEAHVVLPPEAEGAPQLSAIMSPPAGWQGSLVGMNGGVIDVRSLPLDAAQPLRFAASADATAGEGGELSPGWASARLGTHLPVGEEAAELMRTMIERVVKGSPEEAVATARAWVDYLLSDRVTGRMGLFGDALLTGLSAIVGEAELRRIVAEAASSSRA